MFRTDYQDVCVCFFFTSKYTQRSARVIRFLRGVPKKDAKLPSGGILSEHLIDNLNRFPSRPPPPNTFFRFLFGNFFYFSFTRNVANIVLAVPKKDMEFSLGEIYFQQCH